jgi:hypothetical protein
MKIRLASLVVATCLSLSQALGAYELALDARALHEAWELVYRLRSLRKAVRSSMGRH